MAGNGTAGEKLIVMGASAGGVTAYQKLFADMAEGITAPIVCVQHLDSRYPSKLPEILSARSDLKVESVTEEAVLEPGRAYIAGSDHNLIIEGNRVVTSFEDTARFLPSINRLFASAARSYGKGVIAVLLTGLLDDGVEGLLEVHRYGGRAVVQSIEDATFSSMPYEAIQRDHPEFIVPLQEIPALLEKMARAVR